MHVITEKYLLNKLGEPDLKLSPGKDYEEQRLCDDIAKEYWLYFDEQAAGGCVLYGNFGERWVVNPSARWVMRYLANHYVLSLSN